MSHSFAILTVLFLAVTGCDAGLKVQVSLTDATCPTGSTEACQSGLHLLTAETLTNDPEFAVSWESSEHLDEAAGFTLHLATSATCERTVKSFTKVTGHEAKLTDAADGAYFLCLFGKDKNGQEIAADNNGLPLTIDRTAPLITLAETFVAKAPIVLTPTVDDLLDTTTRWEKISGPGDVTFSEGTMLAPTVAMSQDGVYALRLTVTDAAGNTATKLVSVVWDTTPPVIAPLADIITGAPFLIDAVVTSIATDLPLMYSWSMVSGPGVLTPTLPYPAEDITAAADTNGLYVLRLAVTDAAGNTATRDVNFTWDNEIPTVHAGSDIITNAAVTLNATTTLAATVAWSKVSGPGTVTFTPANTEDTTVSANTEGTYVLRLSAVNSSGSETRTDDMTFVWDVTPPVFTTPVSDQSSNAPISVTPVVSDNLTTVSYTWTKVTGPGNVVFSNPSAAATTITVGQEGVYELRLTATDAAGNTTNNNFVYTYDATAPTLTSLLAVNAASDGYVNASEAASTLPLFQLTASGHTNASYTALLNDATPQTCDGTKTYGTASLPDIDDITADGTWAICVKLVDAAGNITYGKSQVVTRDTVTPTFTSLVGVDEGSDAIVNTSESSATNPLWSLTASNDNAALRAYTLPLDDTTPVTCDGTKTYDQTSVARAIDLGSNKPWVICVRLSDDAANLVYGKSTVITRSVTAPTFNGLTRTAEGTDGYVNDAEKNQTNALWTLDATAYDTAMYTVPLDNTTPVSCDSGKTYDQASIATATALTSDVPWVICVKLVDGSANVTYGKSQVITRDVTAPTFTSLARHNEAADGYVNDAEKNATLPAWLLTASGHSSVNYTAALDESTPQTCDSGKTYGLASIPGINDITSDGTWVICAKLVDAAGNVAYGKSQSIIRDTVLPTFTSLNAANEASDGYVNASETSATSLAFSLSASGYTLDDYTAFLDDTPAITCDSGNIYGNEDIPQVSAMPVTDDRYAVCVRLQDAAGNAIYRKSQTVVRDVVAPPLLTSFSGATDPDGGGILLSFAFPGSTADYASAVIRRLAGATAPTCATGTAAQTYTTGTGFTATSLIDAGLTAGSVYSYRVCVTDAAGNVTSTNTATNIKASGRNDWDFSNPAHYTFDSMLIGFSAGIASLLPVDQTDDDDSSSGFGGGFHAGTRWDGVSALSLNVSAAGGALPIPDDYFFGIDNANFVLLQHFNGIGYNNNSKTVDDKGRNGTFTTPADSGWKTVAGKHGLAIQFDGVDDYISIPFDAALSPTQISAIAWVKFDGSGFSNVRTVMDGGHACSAYRGWVLQYDGSTKRMTFSYGNTANYPTANSSVNPGDGKWHQVIGTRDGSTINIYVDGQLSGTAAYTGTPTAGTGAMAIGGATCIAGRHFPGAIDEVAVLDRALSATEIATLYDNQTRRSMPSAWDSARLLDGNVLLMHFDETAAPVVDYSALGHDGTVAGGALLGQTGQIGKAISFDGVNDFVSIPLHADLQATTISIAAWIKASDADITNHAIIIENHDVIGFDGWSLQFSGAGAKKVDFYYGNGTAWQSVQGNTLVGDDQWHHILVTLDGTGFNLYVDGQLDATAAYSGTPTPNGVGNVMIGAFDGTSRFYKGRIDELAIWNRVVSAAEAAMLYDIQKGGHLGNGNELPIARLTDGFVSMQYNVIYFRLNEKAAKEGTKVIDYSGLARDGTLATGSDGQNKATNGQLRGAFTFDGTDDAITSTATANHRPTGNMTVSAWVKWGTFFTDGNAHPMIANSSSATNGFQLMQATSAPYNRAMFRTYNETAAALRSATGQTLLTTGQWYLITGTYDGANVKIYVNGVLDSTTAATGSIGWGGTTPVLTLGSSYDGSYFDGNLDEVAMWARTLSAAEIAHMYEVQSSKYQSLFESRVMDIGGAATWSSLMATPDRPYGKALPGNGAAETGYSYYDANGVNLMNSNMLLMHLDEASGAVADHSGSGYTGTVYGAQYGQPGVFGSALNFDGVDDYVDLPDGFADFTGGLTFSVWAYPTGTTSYGRLIELGNGSGNNGNVILGRDGVTQDLVFFVCIGGTCDTVKATSAFTAGVWQHLSVTMTAGGAVTLYKNGVAVQTGTTRVPMNVTRTVNYLAKSGYVADVPYKGSLDEVSLWNRPLSAAEVRELYLRGTTRVRYQVRSCDSGGCDDESWQGSNGTQTTFLSEFNNSGLSPQPFTFASFPSMTIGSGRFFQYRALLSTDVTTYPPRVEAVTVNPAHYYRNASLQVNTGIAYSQLLSFTGSVGAGSGNVTYQLSKDGTNWHYHNGTTWKSAVGAGQSNTATQINSNVGTFHSVVGTGTLYVKAFLNSPTGTEDIELDQLQVGYFP